MLSAISQYSKGGTGNRICRENLSQNRCVLVDRVATVLLLCEPADEPCLVESVQSTVARWSMKLYFVDAFAERPLCGNPAPVIFEADGLSDNDKQRLAREFNASETVFVSRSQSADFRLQFFTPRMEVDLCGHGTIGAFWVLASTGAIRMPDPNENVIQVLQETRAGVLPVDIHFGADEQPQAIMMHQQRPVFQNPSVDRRLMAEILGLPTDDLREDLPILNVSTGRAKLMVPVHSRNALFAAAPDFKRMTELCAATATNGVHVFSFETRDPASTTTARHFAPTAGVNEDLVTGIAAGALGCYLVRYAPDFGQSRRHHHFCMEQGYNFEREGKVIVDIETMSEAITAVRVGGLARILFQTTFPLEQGAAR